MHGRREVRYEQREVRMLGWASPLRDHVRERTDGPGELRRVRQPVRSRVELLGGPLRVRRDERVQWVLQQRDDVRALYESEQRELRYGGTGVRGVHRRAEMRYEQRAMHLSQWANALRGYVRQRADGPGELRRVWRRVSDLVQ